MVPSDFRHANVLTFWLGFPSDCASPMVKYMYLNKTENDEEYEEPKSLTTTCSKEENSAHFSAACLSSDQNPTE